MRNYSLKWGVRIILSINCCPRLKHYPWNCAQPIVCLLSHNVITTCINLHLFCEICFWTLIEKFCFYTMFITFIRWRLSVGIKRFAYLLTYLKLDFWPWPLVEKGFPTFCAPAEVAKDRERWATIVRAAVDTYWLYPSSAWTTRSPKKLAHFLYELHTP